MIWHQAEVRLPEFKAGFHLITDQINHELAKMPVVKVGLLNLFLQHTSAALTINENADPDVRRDLQTATETLVPATLPFRHTAEGLDDMPAHVKSSLYGVSLNVPIRNAQMLLGTWQGIYLCEFRHHGGPRRILLTLHGQ